MLNVIKEITETLKKQNDYTANITNTNRIVKLNTLNTLQSIE